MSDGFLESADEYLALAQERMTKAGMGARVGFGERAAVLVVDLITGFTDARSPMASDLDSQVQVTSKVLEAARAATLPIVLTTSYAVSGRWSSKVPSNQLLVPGSEWVEIDARLNQVASDLLLVKAYASCFFGTDLLSRLVSRDVDTVIITGCTTSGCIRATAVDACSLGFRTIVVSDGVGDRAPLSHKVTLFDLDNKYADVVESSAVLEYLEKQV